ncbi:MAG: hypothetical protein KDA92_26985, partial [Planctomycetales bacterium]|nr:hypothetical protein [Planctomycetales bacterium]
LSDLRSTQNNFMSVWLNYYANRIRLARDTGMMQLDDGGFWIDVPVGMTEELPAEEEPIPPPLPKEWVEQAFDGESVPEPLLLTDPPMPPIDGVEASPAE